MRRWLSWLLLCGWLWPTVAFAQTPREDAEILQRVFDKAGQLDRNLRDWLKQLPQPVPVDPKDQKLVASLETPTLQTRYWVTSARTQVEYRVLVAKLTLLNLTPQPKTIEPEQISLDADGQTLKNGVLDVKMQEFPIQVGQQAFPVSQLKPTSLKLAPGVSGSTWIVFGGLPRGPQLPTLKLKVAAADAPLEVDLNAEAAKQLKLTVQRMGPRNCLALLTLDGEVNMLTYASLIAELERLAAQKVSRIVLRWTSDAPAIDSQLSYWFINSVQMLGRETQNAQFVSLPSSFTEFRLAELPAANRSSVTSIAMYGGPIASPAAIAAASPVHAKTAEAVSAALRTAYEVLPRSELLGEIQNGEVLTRCAALEAGAERLNTQDLPLLFELTAHAEAEIRKAAIHALRHFGDAVVIDKLLDMARGKDGRLASAAVESLAASRYADAHEAALKLLDQTDAESRKNVVRVLAQNPRPLWSEAIYRFVRDPEAGLGADGLQALVRVGHPRLADVLKESLASRDPAIRDTAYVELTSRNDSESERLTMRFTLQHLENSPPTPPMLAFLIKTKEQSAVPLLVKHLNNASAERAGLIGALAQIGDQSVAASLSEHYERLTSTEKTIVINALGQLKSPLLLQLAASALLSMDASLLSATCQVLTADGRPSSAKLLIDAFEKTDDANSLMYLSNSLSALASRDARRALMKGRASENPQKQSLSRNALLNLFRSSPAAVQLQLAKQFEANRDLGSATQAYEAAIQIDPETPEVYLARGAFFLQQSKFEPALKDFDQALQIDPDHAPSYVSRANVFMRQSKFPEAQKDFEKAWSLDKTNGEALTGVGITRAIAGRFDEGIKLIEEHRDKFPNDALFSYNAACVFGRAAEAVHKADNLPDREKKFAEFRTKAINELRDSMKFGFNDIDWMKKDPDLNSLHDMPEFKELAK